jgi:hypothetical protein
MGLVRVHRVHKFLRRHVVAEVNDFKTCCAG